MRILRDDFHNQLITMPKVFPVNCYLIKEAGFLTLIDCSLKSEAEKIIEVICSEKLPLKYVVLTHAHSDHIGGVDQIKAAFPDAELVLSEKENSDLIKQNKNLAQIQVPIDRLIKDGDRIGSLLVKETPGHTRGSVSLIDLRTNYAFVGDLIQTQGGSAIAGDTRILFPFPAMATQDKKTAIQSFEKLGKENLNRYYCGHGSFLENNPKENQKILARAKRKTN